MPAPFPSQEKPKDSPYPALYLYPLNDTWQPKHISLSNVHTKIGRQTSSKTAPGEKNGFFDSKVLSRQHAEVWEENGKIYIKDVKSSNGTFINGERLSSESTESEPFELKSDDIVEFGIDIVGEDNKTIIHHKVAARVVCVFSEQDAQIAARAEQHQQQQLQQQQFLQHAAAAAQGPGMSQPGPSGHGAAAQNFPPFAGRGRGQLQPGLGGMGGLRPPGKTGLSFDVILGRLQGELQKSRETGAELTSLSAAMNDIHDTLGGNLPTNPPPHPSRLPPVRAPEAQSSTSPEQVSAPAPDVASAVHDLQSQLRETQSSLSTHLDKVRALESVLVEQEAIKQEVRSIRELMEVRREIEERQDDKMDQDEEPRDGFDTDEDDDYDSRSISTVLPHELETLPEEDEEQLAEDERAAQLESAQSTPEESHSSHDVGRPRTPEPSLLAAARRSSQSSPLSQVASDAPAANDDVYEQVIKLSQQVSAVLTITSNLEAQQSAAQSTIQALESKVQSLETMLKAAEDALVQSRSQPATSPPESVTEIFHDWKKTIEGQWSGVQHEWLAEKDKMTKVREDWDSKVRQVDVGLERMSSLQTAISQHLHQPIHHHTLLNGDALKHNGGLVTPPSPRSQSSDSVRYRRRRRRSSGSRGRSRSPSADIEALDGDVDTDTTLASDEVGTKSSRIIGHGAERTLATPAPSLDTSVGSLGSDGLSSKTPAPPNPPEPVKSRLMASFLLLVEALRSLLLINSQERPPFNMQAAVGVVLLSVAAAAVVWKVKPE